MAAHKSVLESSMLPLCTAVVCHQRLLRDKDCCEELATVWDFISCFVSWLAMDDTESADKRPRFGTRYLTETADVYQHNAWDDVEPDSEYLELVQRQLALQKSNPVAEELRDQYLDEEQAPLRWHDFYLQHNNRFFKDRRWLFTEFPELVAGCERDTQPTRQPEQDHNVEDDSSVASSPISTLAAHVARRAVAAGTLALESGQDRGSYSAAADRTILEVGCGAGNTVFPVVLNTTERVFVYACDYAPSAVEVVRSSPFYTLSRCHAFTCDIAHHELQLPEESVDLVVLVFVLSALKPSEMAGALQRLAKVLRPGGVILFRDYARHDLAQVRFSKRRLLQDNFYIRGDGTRVYFFEQDDVRSLMGGAGLTELENRLDKRLIVNRKTKKQMQRIWLQAKYQKPFN